MTQEEYVQQRIDEQISWMEGKSKYNQDRYKTIKLTEIVAAAAIPLLVGFHSVHTLVPVITGVLGVLIVVLSGVQQLYKYHENWLTYRTAIESLKREKFLFISQTDPYNDGTAFQKFVLNCEALLADENKKWKTNWTQKVELKTN